MNMSTSAQSLFRLRSFVRRDGRMTPKKVAARNNLWPAFGLSIDAGLLDLSKIFNQNAPTFLEIGFGYGQSLIELAKQQPQHHFIGVETHKPGIAALFGGIHQHQLTNIRIFDADVIDVLEKCITDESLAGVQIFFPDPWPKRRHHGRRLIQPDFVATLTRKLKKSGELHLATDWDDYAVHMMRVVSLEAGLINCVNNEAYASRSPNRPVLTKFEAKAIKEGRHIWELQFKKK